MASSLPYLASNKNVETLFSKIASAKVPPKFTQSYLVQTIGLKGTNDRALIPLLRSLGFLDQTGTPTAKYNLLKNSTTAKAAIAAGIKTAYAPLFESDEKANSLAPDKLKGLVAQVAGADEGMTARISSTFNVLVKLADFSVQPTETPGDSEPEEESASTVVPPTTRANIGALRPDFHYNIQIHLPSNGDEETYLNIFNALRKTFQ